MMPGVRAVVVVLVLFALLGCGGKPRVSLHPPLPTLQAEQRVLQFQALRRGAEGAEVVTTCGRGGCTTKQTEVLILRNGAQIWYAEDLLPVLPAESAAASAAREVASARRSMKRTGRIGMLMFVGGFVASMVGFANENDPLMYSGLAVTLGGLGAGAYTFVYERRISRKTREAFDHYDEGLAANFAVCVNGMAVVPCEFSGGLPPPAIEADPALRELRQK
jgi:hypothetical protein